MFRGAVRTLAVGLCCLPALLTLGCATGPAATKKDDPLFGVWINEEYDQAGQSYFPKSVMFPDGADTSRNNGTWSLDQRVCGRGGQQQPQVQR
jgi:hypothetical protein